MYAASVPAAGNRPQPHPVMTMWLRAASCPRAHSTWAILLLGGVGIGVYGEGRGWEEGNHDAVSSLTYNKRNNGHWS